MNLARSHRVLTGFLHMHDSDIIFWTRTSSTFMIASLRCNTLESEPAVFWGWSSGQSRHKWPSVARQDINQGLAWTLWLQSSSDQAAIVRRDFGASPFSLPATSLSSPLAGFPPLLGALVDAGCCLPTEFALPAEQPVVRERITSLLLNCSSYVSSIFGCMNSNHIMQLLFY